jgi:hypothetical protein
MSSARRWLYNGIAAGVPLAGGFHEDLDSRLCGSTLTFRISLTAVPMRLGSRRTARIRDRRRTLDCAREGVGIRDPDHQEHRVHDRVSLALGIVAARMSAYQLLRGREPNERRGISAGYVSEA